MFRYALLPLVLPLGACGGDPSPLEMLILGPEAFDLEAESPEETPPRATQRPEASLPAQPVFDPEPYAYELSETGTGRECSTGAKRFASQREMCIHIQDPAQNNDCALTARMAKFHEDCPLDVYEWNTGLQCNVSLIDDDAPITGRQPVDPRYILAQASACVGYDVDALPTGNVYARKPLVAGVDVLINMTYRIPGNRSDTGLGHSALFRFMQGFTTVGEHRFGADTSGFAVRGHTTDHAYRYEVECRRTWACPSRLSSSRP